MKFHCMFEQSGTFKREFQKLGYEAFDYDILNDYGETDYQVDLFKEIQNANQGKPSVFDNISKDDVIIAFYPCIRFEDQILMGFRGDLPQQINWDDEKKLEYDIQLHNELHELYTNLCTLCLICLRGGVQANNRKPLFSTALFAKVLCIKTGIDRQGQNV